MRPIFSCPDPTCPMPWVELSGFKVTKAGIEVAIAKVNGPAASREVAADHAKERRLERKHAFAFDADHRVNEEGQHEPHTLAITLEGELIFVPLSKQPPILYAHLAFVNTETGDADVLEFVPEPPDPVRKLTAHVAHLEREIAAAKAKEETDG
jgi:hypothetical protein